MARRDSWAMKGLSQLEMWITKNDLNQVKEILRVLVDIYKVRKNDERGIKVKLTINWLDVIHFHDDFERNKRYLIKSR